MVPFTREIQYCSVLAKNKELQDQDKSLESNIHPFLGENVYLFSFPDKEVIYTSIYTFPK